MPKRENSFKKWYQLARPNKRLFITQFTLTVCADILAVIEPIFAANVITALAKANFTDAYMWLGIVFGALLLRNMIWDVNFRLYSKLIGSSYMGVHKRIFNKVINAKEKNFKNTSREKLLNIVGGDIATVSYLSDILCVKFSGLIRVLITIVIVFTNDIIVGMLIVLISIANYFILNWINTATARQQKKLLEANEGIFEKLNEVVSGRSFIKDYYLDPNLEEEYQARAKKWLTAKHKQTLWQSARKNWHFVFWNLAVMLVSMYLVYLVSGGGISLTVYLILVPYFASSMERLSDFFNVTNDMKNAIVSTERINSILNFEDKDTINFGGYKTMLEAGDLVFNHVTIKPIDDVDGTSAQITDASFKVKKGEVALFLGERSCGKRALFYCLRRTTMPSRGVVLLNGINVYDFDRSVYKNKVNYTSAKPFFFDGSLLKNFLNIESDLEEVFKINRMLGLHNFILKLPQGYNTNINKNLEKVPPEKRFLIGLSCAILANSNVLMIYEFPPMLPDQDYAKIKSSLKKIAQTRSVLIFSANKRLQDLATSVYNVKAGNVKLISASQNQSAESTSLSQALESVQTPLASADVDGKGYGAAQSAQKPRQGVAFYELPSIPDGEKIIKPKKDKKGES